LSASLLVTVGIGGISLLVVVMIIVALRWVSRRTGERSWPVSAALLGWLALTHGLAASGVLRRTQLRPPPFLLLVVAGLVGVFMLARWNYDIVSGASAAVLAWAAYRGNVSPRLVRAWSFVTLPLLAAILIIAMFSAPPLARFGPTRLNTFVGWPPFEWLGTVCVPGALLGQLLILRRVASA
jgi:hypothetical protein